jgi:hypothetical protein
LFVRTEALSLMRRLVLVVLLVAANVHFLSAQAPTAQAPLKIKVLILTGFITYHDWRMTTPILREILESTGRFEVHVNEEVRGNTLTTFAPYDVLLLNYNDGKSTGPYWDDSARQAMLDFVRNGKGLVCYHSADGMFYGWSEYDKLVGGTWRDTAAHSPYHAFTVSVADPSHAITEGLTTFATNDELYHGLTMQPNIHVLATAFDDSKICAKPGERCGTGKDEPMLWTLPYGAGRVFTTALGHDAKSMQSLGFRVTLQRGTEWAATGQVTIPVPADVK